LDSVALFVFFAAGGSFVRVKSRLLAYVRNDMGFLGYAAFRRCPGVCRFAAAGRFPFLAP
jgi:hypothetical protein